MQAVTKIAVLALCLGLAAAVAPPFSADYNLMQFIMQSRETNNPQRSMDCIYYYMPKLEEINEEYKTSHKACVDTADLSRSGVDEKYAPKRTDIEESAKAACDSLNTCKDHEGSIDYFTCYVEKGNENTKRMYSLSADSSVILNQVNDDFDKIKSVEKTCTSASERAYHESWAATNEEMKLCLDGKTSVPTTAPDATILEAAVPAPALVIDADIDVADPEEVAHQKQRTSNLNFANKVRKHLRYH